MNVTATLFGQMITFVIFVWFIKAYLWEPLTKAMEDRTNKISEGLASAELGEKKIGTTGRGIGPAYQSLIHI